MITIHQTNFDMKLNITIITIVLSILFSPIFIKAQCTPGNSTTCPDLENNGEVCPAVLPDGITGMDYNEEFTILAPPEYDLMGTVIQLHHIKIADVNNLPPGISWQTNAADSVFNVGTYYCVLLSGESNQVGNYPLHIVVDVYIDLFGLPVFAAQIIDSTSISLNITWDPNGIETQITNDLAINLWPNPFVNDFTFEIAGVGNEIVRTEIYSLLGNKLISNDFNANAIDNKYKIDCSGLPAGTYLIKVISNNKHVSKLIRKVSN